MQQPPKAQQPSAGRVKAKPAPSRAARPPAKEDERAGAPAATPFFFRPDLPNVVAMHPALRVLGIELVRRAAAGEIGVFGLDEQLDVLDKLDKIPASSPGLDGLRSVFSNSSNVRVRAHKLDRLVLDAIKDGGSGQPAAAAVATSPVQARQATGRESVAGAEGKEEEEEEQDAEERATRSSTLPEPVIVPMAPTRMRLSKMLPDGASVRVRSAPTLDAETFGSVDATMAVTCIAQVKSAGQDWYRVNWNGNIGYVVTAANGIAHLFEPDAPIVAAPVVLALNSASSSNAATAAPAPQQSRAAPQRHDSSPTSLESQRPTSPPALRAPNPLLESKMAELEAKQSAMEEQILALERELAAMKRLLRSV